MSWSVRIEGVVGLIFFYLLRDRVFRVATFFRFSYVACVSFDGQGGRPSVASFLPGRPLITRRVFFHGMAALAEMERELIKERSKAGLTAALAQPHGGRKPKMDVCKVEFAKQLLNSGMPGKDVARNPGVSRATLYRAIA